MVLSGQGSAAEATYSLYAYQTSDSHGTAMSITKRVTYYYITYPLSVFVPVSNFNGYAAKS